MSPNVLHPGTLLRSALSGTTLPEAISAQAGQQNASIAFGTSPNLEKLSYPHFSEQISAAAAGFAHQGVRPDDRVIMTISNSRDGLLAFLGLIHLGAIPVSVKPRIPGAAAEKYVALVAKQQRALHTYDVTGAGLPNLDLLLRTQAAASPVSRDSDQVAFIQYTSGSTGMPRPVPLSHRAILGNTVAIRAIGRVSPGDTIVTVVPLHHDMGLIATLSSLVTGTNLLIEAPRTFLRHPLMTLRQVREPDGVHSALPDFMLRYLGARISEAAQARTLESGLLRAWRSIFCGAEPIRQKTVRSFLAIAESYGFSPSALVFCYGLAEATVLATAHRYVNDATSFHENGSSVAACLGHPIPGLDLDVVDESGRPCAEAETGSVRLRGPTLFSGYDEATDHRTTWFNTGDLGYLRTGRLYVNGRRDDRISAGGVTLFVTDIEQQVLEIPEVRECVVLPHDATFTVLVVPERNTQLSPARIAAKIVSDFSVAPNEVRSVHRGSITRTASGKPARRHMIAQLNKGLSR